MTWFQTLSSRVKRYPISTAALAAGFKGILADQCVQRFVENRTGSSVDYRRTLFFANFGWLYVGIGQYMIFNRAFPYVIKRIETKLHMKMSKVKQATTMTLMDSCMHLPLIYLPSFYVSKEVFANSLSLKTIKRGLTTWENNLVKDCSLQAAIFIPIQGFNFYWNPKHLRVPFIVAAGFIWMIVLSVVRGGEDGGEKDEKNGRRRRDNDIEPGSVRQEQHL